VARPGLSGRLRGSAYGQPTQRHSSGSRITLREVPSTLALPRGCTCNYDLTHISVQALDTCSQEGSGCSLLLCILRLCQSVFKMPLIENPSSVKVRAVIRFL
jgi:hypothetical protein